MSVLQRIGAFFSLRDEDEEYFEVPEPEPPRRNVVAFAARDGRRSTGSEVSVFVPHAFADVTEIADSLRGRQVEAGGKKLVQNHRVEF